MEVQPAHLPNKPSVTDTLHSGTFHTVARQASLTYPSLDKRSDYVLIESMIVGDFMDPDELGTYKARLGTGRASS